MNLQEDSQVVSQGITKALQGPGPFEYWSMGVVSISKGCANAYLRNIPDQVFEDGRKMAYDVISLTEGLGKIIVKVIEKTHDPLAEPDAPAEAELIFDILNAFILDNLPMFEVYMAKLIEGLPQSKEVS